MDDASRTDTPSNSTSETAASSPNAGGFSRSARRRNRLGKGLSNLLAQPANPVASADAKAETSVEEPASIAADAAMNAPTVSPVKPDAAIQADAANVSSDSAPATAQTSTSAATSAGVVEDAVALFVEYDERLAALMGRLDATCTLLAQTRQLHESQQKRITRAGWMVAAGLALVCGITLWWAGSTTSWHQSQLTQATKQTDILAGDIGTLRAESLSLHEELATTRAALLKANQAIDLLQSKPPVLDGTGADAGGLSSLAGADVLK